MYVNAMKSLFNIVTSFKVDLSSSVAQMGKCYFAIEIPLVPFFENVIIIIIIIIIIVIVVIVIVIIIIIIIIVIM